MRKRVIGLFVFCLLLCGCSEFSLESISSGEQENGVIVNTNTSTSIDDVLQWAEENDAQMSEKAYRVHSFPYFYDETKVLMNYYQEVISGQTEVEHSYVTLESKGFFKRTITEEDYVYFGAMKDNKPEGLGIVLKRSYVSGNEGYCIERVGYFSGGYLNGSGLVFDHELLYQGILMIAEGYEGTYEQGKRTGEAVEYCPLNPFGMTVDAYFELEEIVTVDSIPIMTDMRLGQLGILYWGMYKDGELNGDGMCYSTGYANFIGTYKNGERQKGKEYDKDGTLIYDGAFSNDVYHGKGILYNADGSVCYEGEFENGDIK